MGKKNKAAKKGGEAAGSTCRAADGGGDANTAAANDSSAAAAAASGGKGKRKSDIDDIFGAIAGDGASKKGKAAQEASKSVDKQPAEAEPKPRKSTKVEGNVDDIFGVEAARQRKQTEEGFAIYHEDELRMNQGGDTDKCPFDCTCCY